MARRRLSRTRSLACLFALALAACGGSIDVEAAAGSSSGGTGGGAAGGGGGGGEGGAVPFACGAPAVIDDGPFARTVTADAQAIYAARSDGIVRIPKAGGDPVLIAPTPAEVWALEVKGGRVYWTERSSSTTNADGSITFHADGRVRAVNADGSGLVTLADAQLNPTSLALDATSVYWTNAGSIDADNEPDGKGAILKVAKEGGAITTIAGEQPGPVRVRADADALYAVFPYAKATPDQVDRGQLARMDKDGANAAILAVGGYPELLEMDDARLYYETWGYTYALHAIAKAGGAPTPLTGELPDEQWIQAIALDDAEVYWADTGVGAILAVPKEGGELRVVASGIFTPTTLAVDGACVYWIDNYHHALSAAAKH